MLGFLGALIMQIKIKKFQISLWVMILILAGCSYPDVGETNTRSGQTPTATPTAVTNQVLEPSPSEQKIQTKSGNPAKELQPGSIGNYVWEDLNGNGQQDGSEPGVAGVSVRLLSGQGVEISAVQTDEHGAFLFEDLFAGEYMLEFSFANTLFAPQHRGSDPAKDSDANTDGKTDLFSLGAGEQRSDLDAGLIYPGHAAICPLTGLPTDAELLDNRPIFISISHFPSWATRPSTGLNSAPVVFETLIDEGQTRLQALFYCGYPQDQLRASTQETGFDIRGVRSGRVFYAELAQLFGAGLIFGGASAEVYDQISSFQCGVVDNTGIPKDIGSAGLDIDSLQTVAENCKHPRGNTQLDVWQFGPAPAGGEPAEKFLMHYNYLNQTRWIYDPAAGGYVRYQNDPETPQDFTLSTDQLTGEAVVRQNVLLLQVPHEVLNRSGTIISFDLTDERGYAWLLRDGAIHKVCWSAVFDDYDSRSNRYRPFLLYDCASKESVNLAVGSTWVNVVAPSFWLEQKGEYLTATQPFLGYGP
jgi:hypothetical protein